MLEASKKGERGSKMGEPESKIGRSIKAKQNRQEKKANLVKPYSPIPPLRTDTILNTFETSRQKISSVTRCK